MAHREVVGGLGATSFPRIDTVSRRLPDAGSLYRSRFPSCRADHEPKGPPSKYALSPDVRTTRPS